MNTRTYGRGYAWALVGIFTVLSVILNGAHAVLGMTAQPVVERVLAAIVAIVAPVSLLLATELVVKLIRDWRRRRRWVTALRGVCAATTAGIAMIAFATSAVALTRMAALMGVTPSLAWTLPAVVDAMIVIATLAVVVAEAEMALDRAEAVADHPIAHPADVGVQVGDRPVGDPVDHPITHPAPVADRPPATWVIDRVADGGSPIDDVADHPITHWADSASPLVAAMGLVDHPPVDDPISGGGSPTESVADDVGDHQVGDPADQASTHPSPLGDRPAVTVADLVADHAVTHPTDVGDPPPATTDIAAAVADATRTTKPVEVVVEVLDRAAAGESQRAIAEAVGVDRTVVRKWIRTADELSDDQTARPHLASV